LLQSNPRIAALTIFITGWILVSCQSGTVVQDDEIIARAGTQSLYLSEALIHIPSVLIEQDSLPAIISFRDNWIRNELLYQEAIRLGLNDNPLIQNKIKDFTRDILIQSLLDHMVSQSRDMQVSRQEAVAYYESHKEQFRLNEPHVRFKHLVTSSLEDAENARQGLLRGVSWDDIVERYALNKQNARRDATIFHPVSQSLQNAPPLNQYIRRMGINEISPIRTINGRYHFVQLTERKNEGDLPDLDWIINQIEDWLLLEKKRKLVTAYEQQVYRRAQANKEIHLPELNF
jgi:hypothetical protein